MNIVVLGSLRGAPGVTTTALMVAAGLERSVLVEADLAGGVLAVRYGLGREPGLTTLAAEGPVESDGWRAHAQNAGGIAVLVGPDGAESSEALWRRAGERLGALLDVSDALVVADAGRLTGPVPLLDVASLLVVLVRPVAEHLVALSHRLPRLRQTTRSGIVGAVLVGSGPYRPSDIEQPLGIDVLGVLPDDRRTADLLTHGGRSVGTIGRSRLARAATGVTAAIAGSLQAHPADIGAGR